ncbi:3,4-dihydroxy-2-butanone-4-phosphate synthase [Gordonia sp. YY1]|uniref:3,4-dihydroxy-2-butanone-4-phosphate synthase n=1 Tax=Gordonia sp. YY1 TaxID=396712 RepID=UPI0013317474|nr:3,4-dihydroxy-2-butanone-4-phosphate synthase [Gordonia sp. YY1]KAF0967625.1 Riboflavin biosynthesis protein RibBA [Gordonia sp. YY1]
MTVLLERATPAQDSSHIAHEVFDDVRGGRPVVVSDVESGRVVLALAAEPATTEEMAFVIRFGSGLVTVSLPADRCRVLGLPPMLPAGDVTPGAPTDFAVSVDAVAGVGTGISAADRARTLRALADDRLGHADFTRPGHVLVVGVAADAAASYGRARELGEVACRTGLSGVVAFTDLVSVRDETQMADAGEAFEFADEHGLRVVTVQQIRGTAAS